MTCEKREGWGIVEGSLEEGGGVDGRLMQRGRGRGVGDTYNKNLTG